MGENALQPRDAGAWPRGAFALAVLVGCGAVAASTLLVVSAGSPFLGAGLALVFLSLAAVEAAVYVDALRPWLAGRGVPERTRVTQPAVLGVVLFAFTGGIGPGAAALCGVLAGVGIPTAGAIRQARLGRALEERREVHPAPGEPAVPAAYAEEPAVGVPRVGEVLGETARLEQARWLAWAAATLAVVGGSLAADATAALVGTLVLSATAMSVVGRRAGAAWLAVRDFDKAVAPPRRAFVVLLHDPNPRATGPLLAVWDAEPESVDGQLPRPEAVYRCDDRHDALLSAQGGIVVHEAWVDSGTRSRPLPRWVVADDGVALPRRRAVRGRGYVVSAIGAEQPARARLLTLRPPHPTTEEEDAADGQVITETTPAVGRWAVLFAWRLAVLVLTAAAAAAVATRL